MERQNLEKIVYNRKQILKKLDNSPKDNQFREDLTKDYQEISNRIKAIEKTVRNDR